MKTFWRVILSLSVMAPRGDTRSQISVLWRGCRLSSVNGSRRVLSLWLFYMQASVSWIRYRFKSIDLAPVTKKNQTIPNPTVHSPCRHYCDLPTSDVSLYCHLEILQIQFLANNMVGKYAILDAAIEWCTHKDLSPPTDITMQNSLCCLDMNVCWQCVWMHNHHILIIFVLIPINHKQSLRKAVHRIRKMWRHILQGPPTSVDRLSY